MSGSSRLAAAIAVPVSFVLAAGGTGPVTAAPDHAAHATHATHATAVRREAGVVIGATLPTTPSSFVSCGPVAAGESVIPRTVTDGISYTVPFDGVITSYSHRTVTGDATTRLRALLVRPSGPGFTLAQKSALSLLPPAGTLATFPVRLPARAGDVLALNVKGGTSAVACANGAGGMMSLSVSDVDTTPTLVEATPWPGTPDISAFLEPDADHDGFGDLSQDACPTGPAVQTPCLVPDTTVTKAPHKRTRAHHVKIRFASPLAGSTFLCTVDFKAAKACQSPLKVRGGLGKHRVLIQAVSAAYGTSDATPAEVRWRVLPRKH